VDGRCPSVFGKEIAEMLVDTGFVGVEVKPALGFMSIVTGRKP
jgi:hypothetical protein